MKTTILLVLTLIPFILNSCSNGGASQNKDSEYILVKKNGRIIKAYNAFRDFLNSDKSWASYKKILLDAYPEVKAVHKTQLNWGSIDSAKFPEEVTKYKKEDWEKYFSLYDDRKLNTLYDSVIELENKILKPVENKPVDLCLFLPYGSCFIITGPKVNTIYISLLIDTADVKKIMVHEYAHNLHSQRHTEEPFNLGREVVSEGIAVYLTTLTIKDIGIYRAIPFMPEASVRWCYDNEKAIRDSISKDLADTTFNGMKKYISDGSFATPPRGFVEKTAYFTGYRIIEACIRKGFSIDKICSMNSKDIIRESRYFE